MYKGLREKLIEITAGSLLTGSDEEDTELATQIVDDLFHYLFSLGTDEKLKDEMEYFRLGLMGCACLSDEQKAQIEKSVNNVVALVNLSKLQAVSKIKEESEARLQIIIALTEKCEELQKAVEEAKKEERIATGIELDNWIKEETSPYRKIAQTQHAI
jgi:hypothetical protein